MKKVPKVINSILGAAFTLALFPALSPADTIIFKDGQSVEAETVEEQEGNIIFYLHGLKMQVDKRAVLRVVISDEATPTTPVMISGKPAEQKSRPDRIALPEKGITIEPLPGEKPADRPPEKNRPKTRLSGFRNLRWAIARSTFGPLKEMKPTAGQREISEYVRENEDLKMGEARLDSIVYAFWRDQLYALAIWTRGQANYLALRKEVFNRFGVGVKGDPGRQCHFWSDRYSDRMLKYGDADQSGLFWMRSKELDRRYILSRIKIPPTSLKAMEARAFKTN
jgi:hypothetical protein